MQEWYHENPAKLHIGTEEPRNYYVPFAPGENPFAPREQSSRLISLDGEWGFDGYASLADVPDNWVERPTAGRMPVPGCWQLNGFGEPMYVNVRYPIPYDPPYVPVDNPAGVYRRAFSADLTDGMRWLLHFEGVDSCYYLYLNGAFVGYSQVTHNTSVFDATPFLRQGDNTLVLLVLKWCDGTYLEDQDKFRLSGVIRSVYFLKRPQGALTRYTVQTSLDGDAAELRLNADAPVDYTLRSPDGALLASGRAEDGRAAIRVENPLLWSAENPTLYALTLETPDEVIGERVGFRAVCIRDGVLTWNGVPVKLRGVNRHESDPVTGACISREQALRDLLLMKRCNVNAIRTSHYPDAPEFLQMCDELGFYVIDEADIESHGSADASLTTDDNGDYSGIALLANRPEFARAIADRVEGMIARDVNRPCILTWSLGNESGYSEAFKAAAERAHKLDPTRPVHYESVHQLRDIPRVSEIWTENSGHVYKDADDDSPYVSDVVAGDVLAVTGVKDDDYLQVRFPDGRLAWADEDDCQDFDRWIQQCDLTPEKIVATAKRFMGVPYLWGGTSSKSLDCSGLVAYVLFLNRISSLRDVSQQMRDGTNVDISQGLGNIQAGDFLIFGERDAKGEILDVRHIGIAMGNNEFIHAATDVHVSSFDPAAPNHDARNTKALVKAIRYCGAPFTATYKPLKDNPNYKK